MRNKIFMYLFIFALLFVIFQYMNEKKIYESLDKHIDKLEAQNKKDEDSLDALQDKILNLNYFTLQGNENAMTYLEKSGYEADEVEEMVTEKIYDDNLTKGNNSLIPYEGINGAMKINKLKFLNHKWILADFTDGKYWGEMIIEYSINDKKELELKTISSFLYPG